MRLIETYVDYSTFFDSSSYLDLNNELFINNNEVYSWKILPNKQYPVAMGVASAKTFKAFENSAGGYDHLNIYFGNDDGITKVTFLDTPQEDIKIYSVVCWNCSIYVINAGKLYYVSDGKSTVLMKVDEESFSLIENDVSYDAEDQFFYYKEGKVVKKKKKSSKK